jgi:non-homologous end joining protein Ku
MDPSDLSPYLKDKLTSHQKAAGKVGGLSRSEKKRLACKRNLEKARMKRWPSKEIAATYRNEALDLLAAKNANNEQTAAVESGTANINNMLGLMGVLRHSSDPEHIKAAKERIDKERTGDAKG